MRRTLAVSLFALVCSTGVYAQAVIGSGAITGLVKDIYGDGIPECNIVVTNKVVGMRRVIMTSDDGIFYEPGLIPAGSYDMKVTRRGYADWELPSFDLAVGETLSFRITMYADKPSTPTEALRALSAVQDTKTSVAALVNEDQLANLPTKGRLLEDLVLLAPAVVQAGDGYLAFRGEGFTNAFLFDGVDITNEYFLRHPGVAPLAMQESTAEMQVISSAAPAEFGRSSGGIMNMISKTGTNGLHASAYDYYSQNSWNSPDFFGNGFIPTGRDNQGGVSVGLPISTDSLFLFGNLERINNSGQGLNRITNPLFTDTTGNNVVTTGCTATAAQCTAAADFIHADQNVKVSTHEIDTLGFARMDFRPGERESFTVAGGILSSRAPNGLNNAQVSPDNALTAFNADLTHSTRYGEFGWTHVLSGIAVNELHGGWFRDTLTAATNSAYLPSTGPIAINVDGTPIGGNPAVPFNVREQRYGGTDIFTLTEASHTIKAGADVWRVTDSMEQLYARYGEFNYDSFSAFALDFSSNVKQLKNYSTFDQTLGTAVTNLTPMSFHVFGEDTWKVLPKLTITAGVRWEKERLPQPSQPNPNNYQSDFIPSPNTNFSPRIGIAYQIDKRTVLRAGGGTYYQPFSGQFIRDLWTGGGVYQSFYKLQPNATDSLAFPKVLTSTAATATALTTTLLSQFYTAARFRNPYTEQATLGVERRVNRYVSAAVTAMLSQGQKLWTATDQNLPGGTTVNETYVIDNAAGAATSSYTNLVWDPAPTAHKYQVDTEGNSRYRGATAQVRTAPLFGMTAQLSYTYSQATDDVSGPAAYSVVPSYFFPGSYAGDKGNSNYDVRNRAVVNWVWTPIFNQKHDALSRFVINGWMIAGIGTYQSSMYETPLVEVAGQQFSGITMLYTTSLTGTDGWSRAPFLAVNSLPIGTHENVDVRVSRSLPFTERLRGKLTFEAFNVANHQNNSSVNDISFTAVSGVIKPVTGAGLPNASYAYPFGTTARHLQVSFRLDF